MDGKEMEASEMVERNEQGAEELERVAGPEPEPDFAALVSIDWAD